MSDPSEQRILFSIPVRVRRAPTLPVPAAPVLVSAAAPAVVAAPAAPLLVTNTTTTRLHHHHHHRHPGITCDECGMSPIVGTRYKATHLYDYDICTACFQDHVALLEKKEKKNNVKSVKKNLDDDGDDDKVKETKTWTDPSTTTNNTLAPPVASSFSASPSSSASASPSSSASSLFVAFPHAVDRSVSRLVCQVPDNSLRATSLAEAADKIGRNAANFTSAHLTIVFVVHDENETDHSSFTAQAAAAAAAAAEEEDNNHNHNNHHHNNLYSGCHPCNRASSSAAPITRALAINTYLTQLHIHICWETFDCTNTVVALAQGMAANTSLERVFWHIGKESRNAVTATAIRNMIVTNTTIAALYIGRDCFGQGLVLVADEGDDNAEEEVLQVTPQLLGLDGGGGGRRRRRLRLVGPTTRNNPGGSGGGGAPTTWRHAIQTSNQFASIIFEGLKYNTTLRILRLAGYHVLSSESSDTTLEVLLDIVQHENRTIGKVYADFNNFFHHKNINNVADGDTIRYDHRLDLLLACNREQWMERFANTDATRHEQLDVLWEAIHYDTTSYDNNINNNNNHHVNNNTDNNSDAIGPSGDIGTMTTRSVFWDPVAVAFHLLRSRPDFLSVGIGRGG
jgi:hypothetical protein